MTIETSKLVTEYIRNVSGKGNIFNCPHCKDHCGRLLFPLDAVVASILADDGESEILVKGTILRVNEWDREIEFEPDDNFKDFGFGIEWVDAGVSVRFPSGCLTLANELRVFFASINSYAHSGTVLYKNGNKMNFS